MAKKGKGKGKGKGKKASAKAAKGVGETIKGTALGVVDEVEKAGGVVLDELKTGFDFITGKVADTAKAAADTTVAVKDAVTSKEVTDQLHGLLKEVEDVGESLAGVVTTQFDALRKTMSKQAKKTKTKARKKAAKKKATARKKATRKKATRKKATRKKATRKKATRKKATTRKKASPRKKTTARKKTTRKKTTARKKTTRKKTAARKRSR